MSSQNVVTSKRVFVQEGITPFFTVEDINRYVNVGKVAKLRQYMIYSEIRPQYCKEEAIYICNDDIHNKKFVELEDDENAI